MKSKIKIQFPINKRSSEGVEYRGARLPLRLTELDDMDIDINNPYVDVEYDVYGKKIIITPAE